MAKAVLRVADQRANRAPTHCVKTGVWTEGAVRVRAAPFARAVKVQLVAGFTVAGMIGWMLRRKSFTVLIAVSPEAWRRWHRALLAPVLAAGVGAGLLGYGIAGGAGGAIGFGVTLLVIAVLLRMRAATRWWIGLRFRPDRDDIVVSGASAEFDDDARKLYIAGVTRP